MEENVCPPSVERRRCNEPISFGAVAASAVLAVASAAGAHALTFLFSAKARRTVVAAGIRTGIRTGCRKHGYRVVGTKRWRMEGVAVDTTT